MKTQSVIKFAALLLVCCAMFGCGKDSKTGSIYGTVTDFVTGDPVGNANVRLYPRGETTLTGSDGTFQFYDLSDGRYSLSLSKNGYVDLDDDYVIEIENGNSVRRDVQLNPGVESFKITVNGVETDTMFFYGYSWGSFLVTNDGSVPIRVSGASSNPFDIILYQESSDAYWESSILQPNQGCSVRVCYDAIKTEYIYVSSSQISKTIFCIDKNR